MEALLTPEEFYLFKQETIQDIRDHLRDNPDTYNDDEDAF